MILSSLVLLFPLAALPQQGAQQKARPQEQSCPSCQEKKGHAKRNTHKKAQRGSRKKVERNTRPKGSVIAQGHNATIFSNQAPSTSA